MKNLVQLILSLSLAFVAPSLATAEDEVEVANKNPTAAECQKLRFRGDIDSKSIIEVEDQVISCLDLDLPTQLSITSPGGEVDAAHAFYDRVMGHKNHRQLTTVATGGVSSAAVTMYLAGEQRLISKYGNLLIHMVSVGMNGNFTLRDIEEYITDLRLDQDIQAKITAERTGLDLQVVLDAMFRGTTYTSQEALKFNFATALSQ